MPALSDEQRRVAFLAPAGIVAGTIVLLALLGGGRGTRGVPSATRARAAPAPRIVDTAAPTAASVRTNDAPTAQDPMPGPEADAARFLSAYLEYEVADLGADARAQLMQTATPALANRLVSHPVELPPGEHPPVGQMESLQLEGRPGSRPTTVRATIDQDGWTTELGLHLEQVGSRWLVASLG